MIDGCYFGFYMDNNIFVLMEIVELVDVVFVVVFVVNLFMFVEVFNVDVLFVLCE